MRGASMNPKEAEVWRTVEALNQCWTRGSGAGLRDYFHEEMTAITPADRGPLVGRDACVAAWMEYAKTTRIISWETSRPRIRIYGATAIVTYVYEMVCDRDGTRFSPSGRDMMVLIQDAGRWSVVADQFSPFPGGGGVT